MTQMYCVLVVGPNEMARVGLFSEATPTTATPRITRCLAGPLDPGEMAAWLADTTEGQVAEQIMDDSSRSWLSSMMAPKLGDRESVRIVVHTLTSVGKHRDYIPKIQAIKALREYVGYRECGLKDAKDEVERIAGLLISVGLL